MHAVADAREVDVQSLFNTGTEAKNDLRRQQSGTPLAKATAQSKYLKRKAKWVLVLVLSAVGFPKREGMYQLGSNLLGAPAHQGGQQLVACEGFSRMGAPSSRTIVLVAECSSHTRPKARYPSLK